MTVPDLPAPWREFPNTVLHFRVAPAASIDLRRPIAGEQRTLLRRLSLERSFGIVTAQNPGGVRTPISQNSALAVNLQSEVKAIGCLALDVDACNPDRSHCEQSLAVAASKAEVAALGRRYDQLAIFWFDGHCFWIVDTSDNWADVPLPLSFHP